MYANGRIVRALFERITADYAKGQTLDEAFDGGEWSGPAWGERWVAAQDKAIQIVASKLGVSFEDIEWEYLALINEYPHHLPYDSAMLDAESER